MRRRYPEPPWTYSPKEVNEWLNAVYGGHECRKCKVEKRERWLKNIEIDIDLNVERVMKKPTGIFARIMQKIRGGEMEEHFELVATTEIILRALQKAGFKRAIVKIDGRNIGEDKIRRMIEEIAIIEKEAGEAFIHAFNDGEARIKISKFHPKKRHSIEARISKIKERNFRKFLIYIRKRLEERREEIK